MARYYNPHRNLMLYNPSLWQGDRAYVIGFSWNHGAATKADQDALNQHHWEHECLAQTYLLDRKAMALCQDSPKLHSQEAYEAACAVEKLANFNPYWRDQDERHDLLGQSVMLMNIATKSPDPNLRKKAEKFRGAFNGERYMRRQDYREWHKSESKDREFSGFE